jgi:hypothetical protein
MRALVFYLFTLVLTLTFFLWRWRRRAPDGGLDQLRMASQVLRQGELELKGRNGHHPPRPRPQASA